MIRRYDVTRCEPNSRFQSRKETPRWNGSTGHFERCSRLPKRGWRQKVIRRDQPTNKRSDHHAMNEQRSFWVYVDGEDPRRGGYKLSIKPLRFRTLPKKIEPLIFECGRPFPSIGEAREHVEKLFGLRLKWRRSGGRSVARLDFFPRT